MSKKDRKKINFSQRDDINVGDVVYVLTNYSMGKICLAQSYYIGADVQLVAIAMPPQRALILDIHPVKLKLSDGQEKFHTYADGTNIENYKILLFGSDFVGWVSPFAVSSLEPKQGN